MERKKIDKSKYPAIDGQVRPGGDYLTCNWKSGKKILRAIFISIYKQDPEDVFYGKPNGSVLYAGPTPGSITPAADPKQLDLIPE